MNNYSLYKYVHEVHNTNMASMTIIRLNPGHAYMADIFKFIPILITFKQLFVSLVVS